MIIFELVNNTLIIKRTSNPKQTLPELLKAPKINSYDKTFYKVKYKNRFLKLEDVKEGKIQVVQFQTWKKTLQGAFIGTIIKLNPDIKEINWVGCHLTDKDIPIIVTMLQRCHSLEKVNFSRNYISNYGALLLMQHIPQLPEIKVVDLSDNDIGYLTCDFIDQHLSPTLITCDLSNNQQADEIIKKHEEGISNREIEEAEYLLGDLVDEFHPGDLLYGLAEGLPGDKGRNPIANALQKVLKPHSTHQLLIVNPLSDWVINKNNLHGAFKKELILFEDFLTGIQPSLYPEDNQPFFRGWSEHKLLCKVGIMWAKQNNNSIHYILDDLQMEAFSSGNRNRADTSVTESEIKFIARFYDNLKDNIVFWRTDPSTKQLVKAHPPWLDPQYKQDWDGYLQAQQSKMRLFPKGKLEDKIFYSTFASRKALSIPVYQDALNNLLTDIHGKCENNLTREFILGYLSRFVEAQSKYDLEVILFEMQEKYMHHKDMLSDKNLENFLSDVVKEAITRNSAPPDKKFFYRSNIVAKVYGNKVLDMKALFKLADQLKSQKLQQNIGNEFN